MAELVKIAKLLGKEEALAKFTQATAAEEAGDCDGAIKLYKIAFKLWDSLDCVQDEDGLPVKVRREAEAVGIDCHALSNDAELETHESPRFDIDSPGEWLTYLTEHGYCVLAGAADADSVMHAKALLWDFLEHVPGTEVKRGDSSTWEKGWVPNANNGLIGVHGFGQSDFCWHARTLPKVRQAFETIWDCNDVIVSFDGGNAFRPWASRPEWKTTGGWWHMDQNAFLENQEGLRCIQGVLTLTDATPATGGLCILPGSHKQHKDVCSRAYAHLLSGNFVQVQPGDPVLNSGAQLVCAKAGDLILWDSRCVHCNTPGSFDVMEDSTASENELLRIAAYVCMTPASWASSEVLAHRKEAFLSNETIDHVPHQYHGFGKVDESSWPSWPPRKIWSDVSFVQKCLIFGTSAALADQGQET